MRRSKVSVRPRNRRAFSIADFECEIRMESKLLTAPLFGRTTGTVFALAADNTTTAPFMVMNGANSAAIDGMLSAVFGPGLGTGSYAASDHSQSNISTNTGTSGGSGITIAGSNSGTVDGSVQAGTLLTTAANSTTQSYGVNGGPGPVSWAVGDSTPNSTNGTATVTFHLHGTDGINPTTNAMVGGGFSLQIIAPGFEVEMNTTDPTGTYWRGLNIIMPRQVFPGFFAPGVVYSDSHSDGSRDGELNGGSSQGSFSFGTTFQTNIPIATGPGAVFTVDYTSTFSEGPLNGGLQAGEHIQATPSMDWSLDISTP
jgi:hypothetical protein